jgi:prepilin peptidase CpaA
MLNIFQAAVVGIALAAVVWDLYSGRIPNFLTFGAALVALCVHAYMGGWTAAGMSLAGWAAGVALFFPFFALGGMGAGDVKLLAAIGAWLGPTTVVWVALFSSIAGGAMALVVALSSGYLLHAIVNIWGLRAYWRVVGPRPSPALTLASHPGPRLAYAVPMLAGLMVALWLR